MNEVQNSVLSSEAAMYLVHHIFLPPQLPHGDDFDPEYETIMLDTIIAALLKFEHYAIHEQKGLVASVITAITNLKAVSDTFDAIGGVNEDELRRALGDLHQKGRPMVLVHGDLLVCHLTGKRWNHSASHPVSECRCYNQQG